MISTKEDIDNWLASHHFLTKKGIDETYTRIDKQSIKGVLESLKNTLLSAGFLEEDVNLYMADTPEISKIDQLKEQLNELSKEERLEIYKYLYNAHGCRI